MLKRRSHIFGSVISDLGELLQQYFCPTQYVTLLFLSYKAHLYTCHKSNNDYLLKLFSIICPTSPFGQPTFNSQSTQIVLASLSACIVTFSSPSKVTRSPQKGLSFRSTFFRNFRMLRRYTLLNMYSRVQQPGTPMHWKEPQHILFTHGMILREKAFPFGDCNSLRCCFLSNRL